MQFHQPSTLEEIVDIVKNAGRMREKVKVIGSGHAYSSLICRYNESSSSKTSEQLHLVSLHNYKRILEINEVEKTVTVQAGLTLRELSTTLYQRAKSGYNIGLSLPVLGSIDMQTISGAISTATHGSSKLSGSLSSLVVELSIVDSKGRVLVASKEQNRFGVTSLIWLVCCACDDGDGERE